MWPAKPKISCGKSFTFTRTTLLTPGLYCFSSCDFAGEFPPSLTKPYKPKASVLLPIGLREQEAGQSPQ